jgi:hypothetical protein
MENVESPFSKDVIFQKKVMDLFNSYKVKGVLIFYIPEEGESRVMDHGLCPHKLANLAEEILDQAETRLKKKPKCSE